MWNKDEVKGKSKQIKGAIKDKVGEVTNYPGLEAARREGKVQEKIGKVRRKVSKRVVKTGKVLGGKR